MFRAFGALILDELCLGSDLSTAELLQRLRKALNRPLSRQTMAAWRRGDQPIPAEVVLAAAAIVGRTWSEASIAVAMRVLGDRTGDPDFARAVRLYCGHGLAEIPSEHEPPGLLESGRRP